MTELNVCTICGVRQRSETKTNFSTGTIISIRNKGTSNFDIND